MSTAAAGALSPGKVARLLHDALVAGDFSSLGGAYRVTPSSTQVWSADARLRSGRNRRSSS